jgi:hypothetical protein
MKKYTSIENTPMKFHNLYVWFLNPLQLLVYAAAMVLLLLGLYGTASGSMVEGLSASTLVGAAIGVGIAFIFMLVAEILLAKRKKAGVVLFLLGYLTTIVNAALSLLKEQTAFAVVSLVIAVVVGLLVFIYYHKRSNLFT